MNDPHDPLPEPGDDPMLEEILSLLKRLEPPLETRLANRRAVAAELGALLAVNQKRHVPWWRRSISIPVPAAACLAVLAALALTSSFRGGQGQSPVRMAAPDQPAERATDAPREKAAIAKHAPDAQPVLEYYATETYLCGIGRVNWESGYSIKEKNHD
jgi:hypothetical protein